MVRLAALLVVLAVLVCGAPAAAHDATTTATAAVKGTGTQVTAVLDLEYDLLMKSAWLYASAYEAKGRSEQLRQLRINRDAVLAYVTDRFAIDQAGTPCTPSQPTDADIRVRAGKTYAVLTLACTCPAGTAAYSISSALFPDAETFVHGTETLLTYDLPGGKGAAVLTTENPTARTDDPSHAPGEFFVLGMEHLLFGLDHLCFLVVLMLGARSLRDAALTASAFTAAHSITFLLAALGLVHVPAAIVEPAIAASIVIMAAATLLGRGEDRLGRYRLPLIFTFGLLHGLGFAGALNITEPASWSLLLPLLSFNLGIEATQLTLIALLHPLLTAARRTRASHLVSLALSTPITLISLYWLLTRLPVALSLNGSQ